MADTIDERIDELAQKPQSVTIDGASAAMHNLKDLAAVADRKAAKTAAGKVGMGLIVGRTSPPNATGV